MKENKHTVIYALLTVRKRVYSYKPNDNHILRTLIEELRSKIFLLKDKKLHYSLFYIFFYDFYTKYFYLLIPYI